MKNVVVGRLDSAKKIEVANDASVADAFAKAGFKKADNETINDVEGNVFDGSETVTNGKSYYFMQSVKAGCF